MYGGYEPHLEHDNDRLNCEIERFIDQWDGTALGIGVRNMFENGDSYEHICEAMDIDIEDYLED